MNNLRDMIQEAVTAMCKERGSKNVVHPELGVIVLNGKATEALVQFYQKLQIKRSIDESGMGDDEE